MNLTITTTPTGYRVLFDNVHGEHFLDRRSLLEAIDKWIKEHLIANVPRE